MLHPSLWILALLFVRLFLFEETQLFELLFFPNLIYDYQPPPPPFLPLVASNFFKKVQIGLPYNFFALMFS